MTTRQFCLGAALALAMAMPHAASAIEVKVSAKALERTLVTQLFNGPDGRFYVKGKADGGCSVYMDHPEIFFRDDRIVVRIHASAKLGTNLHGSCLGISVQTNAEVSFVPEAEGESIGFRDARVEKLSDSKELNFLVEPFLKGKLPQQMKVNAAELMRKVLANSEQQSGYALTLARLKLHSMQVEGGALVVDADADLAVD